MTREIMINQLKDLKCHCEEMAKYDLLESPWRKDVEALEMAIEALEPCEDAISRQTLIERINNAEEIFKSDNMESIASDDGDPFVDGVLSGVFSIRQMVIQAPSVMPQHTEAEMTETKGAE